MGSVPPKRREEREGDRVAALELALERARAVGDALRRVGMAVGSTEELEELLTLIVNTTTEVLEAERATLYLLDESGRLVSRVKKGGELEEIVLDAKGVKSAFAFAGLYSYLRTSVGQPNCAGWQAAWITFERPLTMYLTIASRLIACIIIIRPMRSRLPLVEFRMPSPFFIWPE